MTRKACVILGAGASKDVKGLASPVRNIPLRSQNNSHETIGVYEPPNARDLFAIGSRPHYDPVISRYPGAEYLAQRLRIRSESPDQGFDIEAELRSMANHSDPLMRQNYKHIPPYLRDLLALSSYHWIPMSTYYVELLNVLVSEHDFELLPHTQLRHPDGKCAHAVQQRMDIQ